MMEKNLWTRFFPRAIMKRPKEDFTLISRQTTVKTVMCESFFG